MKFETIQTNTIPAGPGKCHQGDKMKDPVHVNLTHNTNDYITHAYRVTVEREIKSKGDTMRFFLAVVETSENAQVELIIEAETIRDAELILETNVKGVHAIQGIFLRDIYAVVTRGTRLDLTKTGE